MELLLTYLIIHILTDMSDLSHNGPVIYLVIGGSFPITVFLHLLNVHSLLLLHQLLITINITYICAIMCMMSEFYAVKCWCHALYISDK